MAATLPAYEIRTLENGLEVAAIPLNNGSSVVSVDIFYRVGSRNETLGKSGIAHMLEHLSFKSTKNLKTGEYDAIVKSIGGVTNASTGFDYTHYFIKTSAQNLEKPLELFAEMMQNLTLSDEEFQPERNVVAEERRWRTDNNPSGTIFFNLFNAAYSYHPYHWTPIGFMGDIESWTIEDIRDFYGKWYQPQNAILIAAGDFDKELFFSAAQKHFGKLKNRGALPKITAIEPEQTGARRVELRKESEVEFLTIAWKMPAYDHNDTIYLDAISSLLTDGQSSRLEEKLVDKLRLANSVSAFTMALSDPGLFVIMAVCNDGVSAEKVEKVILDEVALLHKKAASKREIDKIKTLARSEFIRSLETSDGVAHIFGSYLTRGSLEPLLDYEEKIAKLDGESLQQAAQKYLASERSTTIILRNK
ncbi:zinc protease [Campylobacterota bacterium]|nr:zinc protease [Campylobacterota bacterium]